MGRAEDGSGARLLIRPWDRERAPPGGGSPERVPARPAAPHALSGRLGARAQLREIDAGNAAVLHAYFPVDNDGLHIVANAAIDEALDRIAHRAEAQGATAVERNDDDVRLGAGREPADVVAPERACAAQSRGLEHLRGSRGFQIAARDLAEI